MMIKYRQGTILDVEFYRMIDMTHEKKNLEMNPIQGLSGFFKYVIPTVSGLFKCPILFLWLFLVMLTNFIICRLNNSKFWLNN